MAKACLYCGIQFDDATNFCPRCGKPTKEGFGIISANDSGFNEYKRWAREMDENDELIRKQGFYYDCTGPFGHMIKYARPGVCTKKVLFHICPSCGGTMVTDSARLSNCQRCHAEYLERNIQQIDCGARLVKRDNTTRKIID